MSDVIETIGKLKSHSSPGASFSKNLKSSNDLKQGKDNGYQGDL